MSHPYPERQYRALKRKRRTKSFVFYFLSLVFFFVAFYVFVKHHNSERDLLFGALFFVAGIVLAVSGSRALRVSDEERIYRAGAKGERQFKKVLGKISGAKFYGVPLKWGDVDAVLVNKRGVFAFEVKNYAGEIHCESDRWYRILRGRTECIKSASEEAMRHAKALSGALAERGITVTVVPVVVFVNAHGRLYVSDCQVHVIDDTELSEFLRSFPTVLTGKEIKRISKCVKEQMFRKY